jgi:hypothetical protein
MRAYSNSSVAEYKLLLHVTLNGIMRPITVIIYDNEDNIFIVNKYIKTTD